jgi:DNA-binding GntR family transcriptional regulator
MIDPSKPRALLKNEAYTTLKDLILSEELPPGTFLSERQLAARLAMSKTPIRSALERLQGDGFLIISPQQGVMVREIPLREVVDLFDIRIALETFIVSHIAGRLTLRQAELLEQNLAEQAACIPTQDVSRSTRLDEDFHQLLCDFLDNQEIRKVLLSLRDRLTRPISRVFRGVPDRFRASYQDHRSIYEAVQGGDPALAAVRMREHLEFGKRFLISRDG